jgi:hypothetical protein
MRTVVDKLSDAYAKYYSPTEHIAADEFIVLFRVGVIFRQCVSRNTNGLGQNLQAVGSKGCAQCDRVVR